MICMHLYLLQPQSCIHMYINHNTQCTFLGGVCCVLLENSGPDIALCVVQMALVTEQVTINWIALLLVATHEYCTGQ